MKKTFMFKKQFWNDCSFSNFSPYINDNSNEKDKGAVITPI